MKIAASVMFIFYVILNRESICGDSFGDSKDILNIKKLIPRFKFRKYDF